MPKRYFFQCVNNRKGWTVKGAPFDRRTHSNPQFGDLEREASAHPSNPLFSRGGETGAVANRVKCPFNIPIIERRSSQRCAVLCSQRSGTWRPHDPEVGVQETNMPLTAHRTRNKFPCRDMMYSVAVASLVECVGSLPPPLPSFLQANRKRLKRSEKMTYAATRLRRMRSKILWKILDGSVFVN